MGFCCNLNAQINSTDSIEDHSTEQRIFIDNLDQEMIPSIFKDLYYSKLKKSDIKVDVQEIDTVNRVRRLYAYSKKARSGYLVLNKKIMDKIDSLDLNKIQISYVLNNKIVSTPKEVNRILKLNENGMQILNSLYDKKNKTLFVFIISQ